MRYLVHFLYFLHCFALGQCNKCLNKSSSGLVRNEGFPDHPISGYVRVSPKGVITKHEFGTTGEPVVIGRIPPKRIIGGRNANKGDVPYQIYYENAPGSLCGGSIYNSKTILTAAHCFYEYIPPSHVSTPMSQKHMSAINFTAGEHDLLTPDGNEQIRNSIHVHIHPEYEHVPNNDIAIVSLEHPFEYNKFVQPIRIGSIQNVLGAVVSGWGYSRQVGAGKGFDDAYFPSILKEATVQVFSAHECKSFLRGRTRFVEDTSICAGLPDGSVDSCQGDSGGPLACFTDPSQVKRHLCGIVSGGIGCGLPGLPGVYTLPDKYVDWITELAGHGDDTEVSSPENYATGAE